MRGCLKLFYVAGLMLMFQAVASGHTHRAKINRQYSKGLMSYPVRNAPYRPAGTPKDENPAYHQPSSRGRVAAVAIHLYSTTGFPRAHFVGARNDGLIGNDFHGNNNLPLCSRCNNNLAFGYNRPYLKRFYIKTTMGFPIYSSVGNNPVSLSYRITGNVAFGVNLNRYFSAEVEGGYLYFPMNWSDPVTPLTSTIKSYRALFNLIVNPPMSTSRVFSPYLGFGIGIVKNTHGSLKDFFGNTTPANTSVHKFIHQFFLGMEISVNRYVSVFADARWLNLGIVRQPVEAASSSFPLTSAPSSFPLKIGILNIGAKFKF